MLPYPAEALVTAAQGCPAYQSKLAPYCYGFMKLFISKALAVNPDAVAAGLARSRTTIAETDALLADGRPFLLGERFTAADLALACMMSPYVMPRNYGIRLPTIDEVPRTMRADIRYFQTTKTGRYVLRLFDTERLRKSPAQACA
jgi:glutathione S-transferase